MSVDNSSATAPQSATAHLNLHELHYNLGNVLHQQGELIEAAQSYGQAIESYRRAIELQPDFVLPHHNLGRLLQTQGHHAKAVTFFQQAIQLDPDYLPAYSDCSVSWMAQGTRKQALPYLRQAIAQQSQFVAAYSRWTAQLSDQSNQSNPIVNSATNQQTENRFTHPSQHCLRKISPYSPAPTQLTRPLRASDPNLPTSSPYFVCLWWNNAVSPSSNLLSTGFAASAASSRGISRFRGVLG